MQQLRQEAGDPVMAGKRLPYPCRVNLPKTGGAVLTKVAAYRSKLLLFIYFSFPKSMCKNEVLANVDVASYKAYITEFGLTFRQLALGM